MRWIVINGSPRGLRSNTATLLEQLLEGMGRVPGSEHELLHLARRSEREHAPAAIAGAQQVLVAFPLYVDAMPGLVMELIEELAPLCGRPDNPSLSFAVQSGFPEAHHSRFVERYLRRLARRLGCRWGGCLIKGGFQVLPAMPGWMRRPTFERLQELGESYARTGRLDSALLQRLARPERMHAVRSTLFRLLNAVGVPNVYWNRQLRANGAFSRRWARPCDEARAGRP